MGHVARFARSVLLLVPLLAQGAPPGRGAPPPQREAPSAQRGPAEPQGPAPTVDGHVVLDALMGLTELRLGEASQVLRTLAGTAEVQSGDWARMRPLLEPASRGGLPINVLWFAQRDGSYFTAEKGATGQSLADRPYFPQLLDGRSVAGFLVVSRSTGKRSVVVAEPVRRNGTVIGAIGMSLSVEALSKELDQRLALPKDIAFYTLDAQGQIGLHRRPELLFEFPAKLESPSLRAAVQQMLSRQSGTVHYEFRGLSKTVLFQRSRALDWVFALAFEKPVAGAGR